MFYTLILFSGATSPVVKLSTALREQLRRLLLLRHPVRLRGTSLVNTSMSVALLRMTKFMIVWYHCMHLCFANDLIVPLVDGVSIEPVLVHRLGYIHEHRRGYELQLCLFWRLEPDLWWLRRSQCLRTVMRGEAEDSWSDVVLPVQGED